MFHKLIFSHSKCFFYFPVFNFFIKIYFVYAHILYHKANENPGLTWFQMSYFFGSASGEEIDSILGKFCGAVINDCNNNRTRVFK